jgi:DNA-binding beta-propeller fold protein YncE
VTLLLGIVAASTGLPAQLSAQAPVDPNGAPNPYRLDTNWLKIPEGRKIGQVTGVDIDPDGKSIWVFDRCGVKDCVNSPLNPIGKFDAGGNFVTGFGRGLFNHPHGFYVDRAGNVWATDNTGGDGKGHVVIKFSPAGKVLLTLGTPGVAGEGPNMFNAPTDVAVAANGDIIVSDGQARLGPGRVRGQPFGGDRFSGPHLRRRPVEQSGRDLQPGRRVPHRMEAVRPSERPLHR